MSYVIYGKLCKFHTCKENGYVNCLIHKTVANIISRICQMSKKLRNLQQKKLFFNSNLHSIHKEKHNFEKKILRECFFMSYVTSVKFHTYKLI